MRMRGEAPLGELGELDTQKMSDTAMAQGGPRYI